MSLIADILLAAGAFGAAFYCMILGRRLKAFNNLENGMGGAVAVLSAQVDDLEKTLTAARGAANASTSELQDLTARAEDVRRQLEIQIASLHDLAPTTQATIQSDERATEPKADTEPKPEPGEPMFVRHRA